MSMCISSPMGLPAVGVGGFHAGPLTTTGTKAQPGNPLIVQVYQGADDPGMTQDMRTAFTVCIRLTHPTHPRTLPSMLPSFPVPYQRRCPGPWRFMTLHVDCLSALAWCM